MSIPDYFLMSREWRALRMQALERDGGECSCCGRRSGNGLVMNVDHIKPRTRYPHLALALDNLQVMCDECNHGKGNRFETDWRQVVVQPGHGTPEEEASRARQLAALKLLMDAEKRA